MFCLMPVLNLSGTQKLSASSVVVDSRLCHKVCEMRFQPHGLVLKFKLNYASFIRSMVLFQFSVRFDMPLRLNCLFYFSCLFNTLLFTSQFKPGSSSVKTGTIRVDWNNNRKSINLHGTSGGQEMAQL